MVEFVRSEIFSPYATPCVNGQQWWGCISVFTIYGELYWGLGGKYGENHPFPQGFSSFLLKGLQILKNLAGGLFQLL